MKLLPKNRQPVIQAIDRHHHKKDCIQTTKLNKHLGITLKRKIEVFKFLHSYFPSCMRDSNYALIQAQITHQFSDKMTRSTLC